MRYIIAFSAFFIFYFFYACNEIRSPFNNSKENFSKKIDHYPADSALFKKIDVFFKNENKKQNFNGNVLIAKDGEILYRESLGYRDLWKKDTLQINTFFMVDK